MENKEDSKAHSAIITLQDSQITILEDCKLLVMDRMLVQTLSCPNDLTFSERKELQNPGNLSIDPNEVYVDQANLGIDESHTLEQKRHKILEFVQKYSECPSVAYRCPRLDGWKSILLFLAISFTIKALFAFNSTSHLYNAPQLKQGDGEFHRHWIEITTHLPLSEWYTPGPYNPKSHCFLDYPIFAAYFHSYIGHHIISPLHPQSVALTTLTSEVMPATEKYESLDSSLFNRSHKYFFLQRLTFLLFDTLFLGSGSLCVGLYLWRKVNPRLRFSATLMLVLTPMTIVIDHGNPQVNFLSLGIFLFAFRYALSSQFAISAALAVCAVSSKVTTISVMLPFVVLVLARLYQSPISHFAKILRLMAIGLAAVAALLILHLPLILTGSFSDMLTAIFPFGRGIVDMRNPTFWQLVIHISKLFGKDFYGSTLPIFKHSALILTSLFQAPSLVALFRSPSNRNFILTIQHCALSFFLFGFCTHQKTFLWYALSSSLSLFSYQSSFFILSNFCSLAFTWYITEKSEIQIPVLLLYNLCIFFHILQSSFPNLDGSPHRPQEKRKQQLLFIGLSLMILILQVIFSFKNLFVEAVFRIYIDVVIALLIPVLTLLWLTIYNRLKEDEKQKHERQ